MEQKSIEDEEDADLSHLQSRSQSSCTDHFHPFFYGGVPQQSQLNDQQILNKKSLHQLVQHSEKTIEMASKQQTQKYIKRVIQLNNQAYHKIVSMDRTERLSKSRKNIQATKNGSTINVHSPQNYSNQQHVSSNNILNQSSKNKKRVHTTPISEKAQDLISSYLCQAETILEYAASCGKNIDRNLIISVLCNQAAFYQKIWDLSSSCIYLEAVIINMQQWGEQSQWSQCSGGSLSLISKATSPFFQKNFINNNGTANIYDDIILMHMRRGRTKESLNNFQEFYPQQDVKLAKNYQLDNNSNTMSIYRNCQQLNNEGFKSLNNQNSQSSNSQKFRYHILQIYELIIFYLQYSSLCGQMGAHQQAITTTTKVLKKLRKISILNKKRYFIEQSKQNSYSKYTPQSMINSNMIELDNRKIILGLNQLDYDAGFQVSEVKINDYREIAKYFIRSLMQQQKRCLDDRKCPTEINDKDEINNKNDKQNNQEDNKNLQKQLKQFTISDLLKIRCRHYLLKKKAQQHPQILAIHSQIIKNNQHDRHRRQQTNQCFLFCYQKISNTLNFPFLFSHAILLSTAYLILATEFRLKAISQQKNQGDRFESMQYKKSQILHLSAIIILCTYVPMDIKYLRHMISSYQNYYLHILTPVEQFSYDNNNYSDSKVQKSIYLQQKFDRYHIHKYNSKNSIIDDRNDRNLEQRYPSNMHNQNIRNNNQIYKNMIIKQQTNKKSLKKKIRHRKQKTTQLVENDKNKRKDKSMRKYKNHQNHHNHHSKSEKSIKYKYYNKNKNKQEYNNKKSIHDSLHYLPSQSLSFRALICQDHQKSNPFFNNNTHKQIISQYNQSQHKKISHSLYQKKNIKSLSKSTNMLSQHSKHNNGNSKNSNYETAAQNQNKKTAINDSVNRMKKNHKVYNNRQNSQEYRSKKYNYHSIHQHIQQQLRRRKPKIIQYMPTTQNIISKNKNTGNNKHNYQLLCHQQKIKKFEPSTNFSIKSQHKIRHKKSKTLHSNDKNSFSPKPKEHFNKFVNKNSKKNSICYQQILNKKQKRKDEGNKGGLSKGSAKNVQHKVLYGNKYGLKN